MSSVAAHEAHDLELYWLASYGYSTNVDLNASHFYQLNIGMGALYQAFDIVYVGLEAGFTMITATMVRSPGTYFSSSETVWSSNGVGYALRFVNIPVDNAEVAQCGIAGSGDAGNAFHVTIGATYQGSERERWYIAISMFQGALGGGLGVGVRQ